MTLMASAGSESVAPCRVSGFVFLSYEVPSKILAVNAVFRFLISPNFCRTHGDHAPSLAVIGQSLSRYREILSQPFGNPGLQGLYLVNILDNLIESTSPLIDTVSYYSPQKISGPLGVFSRAKQTSAGVADHYTIEELRLVVRNLPGSTSHRLAILIPSPELLHKIPLLNPPN